MNRLSRSLAVAVLAAAAATALSRPARAQDLKAALVGYGTFGYDAVFTDQGDNPTNFSARLSPILLFQANKDVLFESEAELELEDGATNLDLEYAQVEYQGFDRVQFVAGKFLLPFGEFGERLHPTWVNKLPSMPVVIGHGEEGVAEHSVIPVLSDVGAMIRIAQPLQGDWKLGVSAWVSQGPQIAEETPDEAAAGGLAPAQEEAGPEIPDIAYGVAFTDNNTNKMVGGRLGFIDGGVFEAYASGFYAKIDPDNALALTGFDFSGAFRRGPLELRAESVLLRQDFIDAEAVEVKTLDRSGFYLQASRRFGKVEPVVRWGKILDATVDGDTVQDGRDQVAVGLDYWIAPSIPVKVAYHFNDPGDDQLSFQWAFGF